MIETELLREIHLAIGGLPDCMVGRNNRGCFVRPRSSQRIQAGLLIDGSSDLIGIGPGGRFLAIEVKRPGGRRADDQRGFIDLVRRYGGIAGFAESVDDALDLIDAARRGG